MWAYGTLLYEMAVSFKPKAVEHLLLPGHLDNVPVFKKQWKKRDPELLGLIRACMKTDPDERITAAQALDHPYFNKRNDASKSGLS